VNRFVNDEFPVITVRFFIYNKKFDSVVLLLINHEENENQRIIQYD